MKAIVDHSLCEGHAKCMDKVPEVFEVREDDRSYILLDEIPEEMRAIFHALLPVLPKLDLASEPELVAGSLHVGGIKRMLVRAAG